VPVIDHRAVSKASPRGRFPPYLGQSKRSAGQNSGNYVSFVWRRFPNPGGTSGIESKLSYYLEFGPIYENGAVVRKLTGIANRSNRICGLCNFRLNTLTFQPEERELFGVFAAAGCRVWSNSQSLVPRQKSLSDSPRFRLNLRKGQERHDQRQQVFDGPLDFLQS